MEQATSCKSQLGVSVRRFQIYPKILSDFINFYEYFEHLNNVSNIWESG